MCKSIWLKIFLAGTPPPLAWHGCCRGSPLLIVAQWHDSCLGQSVQPYDLYDHYVSLYVEVCIYVCIYARVGRCVTSIPIVGKGGHMCAVGVDGMVYAGRGRKSGHGPCRVRSSSVDACRYTHKWAGTGHAGPGPGSQCRADTVGDREIRSPMQDRGVH